MSKKFKLSPTQLVTYNFCPRKYYYRYILGIKEPTTHHMIRGRILHKVMEEFFDHVDIFKKENEFDTWKELAEKFEGVLTTLLDSEWGKIGAVEEYPDVFEDSEQKEEFYSDTRDMLEFYAHKLAYSLTKKKEELDPDDKWYNTNIKRHFYPKYREQIIEDDHMLGYIDKVVSIFGRGVAIVDIKTSKQRLPNFISESHLLQLKAYAYLWNSRNNELPKFVGIEYVRGGNCIFYPLREEDLEEVEELIEDIWEKRKDRKKEAFPQKKQVLCDWCFYKDLCWGEQKRQSFK